MNTRQNRARGVFETLGKNIRESIKRDGIGVGGIKIWVNAAAFVIGFLFGGCHVAFGAYPLGVALVSSLPSSVWPALVGAALGSLTLGRAGMIYALIATLAVFLRIIISGGASEGRGETFSESVPLRMSGAVICGFVAATYEVLLGGLRAAGVVYGLSMIALSTLFTFVFSGVFYHGVGVKDLVFGTRRIFEAKGSAEAQRLLLFKISVAVFIAMVSFSLTKYAVFGIDLSFVFAGVITLFAAKRFGAFYGAAVGFFSSALVSGILSPAFALLGILSGSLFAFGARYAATAGGAALSLWGAYVSGVSGFLSLLPEYLVSLCIIFPMLKSFEREDKPETRESLRERSIDMVGTMALAYRSREELSCDAVERAFSEALPLVSSFLGADATAEDYAVFSRLLKDVRNISLERREMDPELSERLGGVLDIVGVKCGIVRAFGGRRKYVVLAAEDRDGTLITSPRLKEELEKASSLALGTPKYYRRSEIALMECESVAKYKLDISYISERGVENEVSGDTVSCFVTNELYSYGVIADGMGSGSEAKRSSDFAARLLKAVSASGASTSAALHMINALLRRQSDECSVALDVFCLDTVTGDAEFFKSGAASSYIKRGTALYRIKSGTMPLGLMKKVDAERIKVTVFEGDTVIMISDGVSEPSDDAPWLVEILNEDIHDPASFVQRILASARMNNKKRDDISILVMRVTLA